MTPAKLTPEHVASKKKLTDAKKRFELLKHHAPKEQVRALLREMFKLANDVAQHQLKADLEREMERNK